MDVRYIETINVVSNEALQMVVSSVTKFVQFVQIQSLFKNSNQTPATAQSKQYKLCLSTKDFLFYKVARYFQERVCVILV